VLQKIHLEKRAQNIMPKEDVQPLAQQGIASDHKTIMIVEDDEAIGYLLVQALEDEFGCQVILATDGLQALKIVETITPNLFLLDYLLPSINGLELYQRLHTQQKLATTPKILMSANLPPLTGEHSDILTLKKPFDIDELFSLIGRLLVLPPYNTH
jgi:CheY-like chemotaxis protein